MATLPRYAEGWVREGWVDGWVSEGCVVYEAYEVKKRGKNMMSFNSSEKDFIF